MKRQLTPFTYSDIPKLGTKARRLWQADNCDTLADFMDALPNEKHKQEVFCQVSSETECGTAGCAMGWAAMSGLFDGLQYGVERDSRGQPLSLTFPVVNGARGHNWLGAGDMFFGEWASRHRVFARSVLSKNEVVLRLRQCANTLRSAG